MISWPHISKVLFTIAASRLESAWMLTTHLFLPVGLWDDNTNGNEEFQKKLGVYYNYKSTTGKNGWFGGSGGLEF